MSESTTKSNNASTTVCHPHYFNSFQNFCCGPQSKAPSSSATEDLLPIPDNFKEQASRIVDGVNQAQKDRMADLIRSTSRVPYQFFDKGTGLEYQRYFVDRPMFRCLIETRVINWVPSLKSLYPVRTSGNGNCLLHSVLIAMTGAHDFDVLLRDRLVQYMEKNNEQLKIIWKMERIRSDKANRIQSEDAQLDTEWEEVRNLARFDDPANGEATKSFRFLESIHVFTISNMLARPIIVLSEEYVRNKDGEAIAINDLYGIYLPTLTSSRDPYREPLVLGYNQSHFCPLLVHDAKTGSQNDNYLPLHQSFNSARENKLLPVRFLNSEFSAEKINQLLNVYLHIEIFEFSPEKSAERIVITCAELGKQFLFSKPNFFNLYYEYLTDYTITLDQQKHQLELISAQNSRRLDKNGISKTDVQLPDCPECNKGGIIRARCEGCQRRLCSACINNHRDCVKEPSQGANNVHKELQDMLDTVQTMGKATSKFPSIIEIYEWEMEVIEQVRQTAKRLREDVSRLLSEDAIKMQRKLEDFSKDVKQKQRRDANLEYEMKSIQQKLAAFKFETESIGKTIQFSKIKLEKSYLDNLVSVTRNEIKPPTPAEQSSTTPRSENQENKTSVDQKPNTGRDSKGSNSLNESIGKRDTERCARCNTTLRTSSSRTWCDKCDLNPKISISPAPPTLPYKGARYTTHSHYGRPS